MILSNIKQFMSQNLSIKIPPELLSPLHINGSLSMSPGPANIHPRVVSAMSLPIVSHVDPQFLIVLKEVSSGIRYALQTRNRYSFGVTGSATCAMEMAICNLLEKGDTFLVAIHGMWGERVVMIGRKHGYNVVKLSTEKLGHVIEMKEFEKSLIKHKPKLLFVCHGDSSTGTLQSIEGLGQLCHQHNCLLLVDAMMSFCMSPIYTDLWEIDAIFTGGQKALSGPPGVSLLSFSSRAIETIENRKTQVDSYYMDVKLVASAWGIVEENHFPYHCTPAISLIYGLREALAMLVEEGIDNVIARHVKWGKFVQRELEEVLGLEFFVVNEKFRLPCLLTVKIPEECDGNVGLSIQKYVQRVHNVSISPGLGPTVGRVWRIGILGVNACEKSVNMLLDALKEAMKKHVHDRVNVM